MKSSLTAIIMWSGQQRRLILIWLSLH